MSRFKLGQDRYAPCLAAALVTVAIRGTGLLAPKQIFEYTSYESQHMTIPPDFKAVLGIIPD